MTATGGSHWRPCHCPMWWRMCC